MAGVEERRQEAVGEALRGEQAEERKRGEAVVVEVPHVGGIRRRERKVLAEGVALCRQCASGTAAFVDYDNVLEVFHMPLWRWPGWNPALVCSQCGYWLWTSHFEPPPTPALSLDDDVIHPSPSPSPSQHLPERETGHCWSCSHVCQPLFKFCPSCGARQDFW